MYDFIEEYFPQIIVGMLVLAIWTIYITSWISNQWNSINAPIVDSRLNSERIITEESIIPKEDIVLSGSMQDLSLYSTIISRPESSNTQKAFFTVNRVIDWDTIDIWLNANVRILGIDAPESSAIRYGYTECDGKIASTYTKNVLLEKRVIVEKDTIQPERDKYGRYLLHIWIDNQLFAEKIISDGYAKQYSKVANTYSSLLASAEAIAQMNNRWLWWDCKQ